MYMCEILPVTSAKSVYWGSIAEPDAHLPELPSLVDRLLRQLSSPVAGLRHSVSDPAHVENVRWGCRIVAELAAETSDKGAHGVRLARMAPAPNMPQEGFVGHDASGGELQPAQERVLGGPEPDRVSGERRSAQVIVDGELSQDERLGLLLAPQRRSAPRNQLCG